MPGFLVPAIFGTLSALGGRGRNRSTSAQNTESTSSQDVTRTGTGTSIFNNTSISDFNPAFAGVAADALQGIFSRFGPNALSPEDLETQELVERERVNRTADRLFGSQLAGSFSRGTGFSGAGNELARGFAEMFRGSNLLDVAGTFAQRRFELPVLNERIAAGQRSDLAQILSLLPRSNTQSGTSENTSTDTTTGTTTTVGTSTASDRTGGGLANIIAGGLAGFGQTGGFDRIPGIRDIFGRPAASSSSSTNAFQRLPPFRPIAQNPFG